MTITRCAYLAKTKMEYTGLKNKMKTNTKKGANFAAS